MSLFNEFSKKHSKQSISFQVYSDYLDSTFNSEDYKFNDKTSAYYHEDLFIPCTNRLYFKLSDNNSIRKNTIALDCDLNGEYKLSFKLGRFVVDIEDEEFSNYKIDDNHYNLGMLGGKTYEDFSYSSAKYAVKSAECKSFEAHGPTWLKQTDNKDDSKDYRQMFVLDVFVLDASIGNWLYKGEKALKNATRISGTREYEGTKFGEKTPGFLHFDRVAINNLVKNETKVEIQVHSDLNKDNKWVKILSKSGSIEDSTIRFDGKFISCNQALLKVVTSQG